MILCINGQTGGVAEWSLDWLGVATHAGGTYGVTVGALLSLGGDAENGFVAEIETGELPLGDMTEVQIPRAYLAYKSGPATLSVSHHRLGSRVTTPYDLPERVADDDDGQTFRTCKLARGPRAPWWSFKFSGASWLLNRMQVLVSRRSKKG